MRLGVGPLIQELVLKWPSKLAGANLMSLSRWWLLRIRREGYLVLRTWSLHQLGDAEELCLRCELFIHSGFFVSFSLSS